MAGALALLRYPLIIASIVGAGFWLYLQATNSYDKTYSPIAFAFIIGLLTNALYLAVLPQSGIKPPHRARLGLPTVPRNVQRGLLRLYLVVPVPWVAWFGYQILDALDRHRPVSGAVWSLLIVPIGGPLLYLVAGWVIAGFRKPASEAQPKPDEAPPPLEPPSHRPPADYYPVIARAVSRLTDNTPEARQTLYDRARMALTAQLDEHDQLQIECERRALEAAIHRVENQRRAPEFLAKQPSTALLIASIILLSKLWVLDPTSMSLYRVARLPRR
jgi:hypothetical protein